MIPANTKTLMDQVIDYPLPLRIACKLYLEGVTEIEFHKFGTENRLHPDPVFTQIYYFLRNLERGHFKLSKKLIRLSKKL